MAKVKKIKSIKNFSIFKNFEWDNELKDNNGNVLEFKEINILFGRNYSGKTSLSRIIRSIETRELPEKCENPEFEVEFDGGDIVIPLNLSSTRHIIRVFNEDFVKKKLRFIVDEDDIIEPFSVILEGLDENEQIYNEIKALDEKLGHEAAEGINAKGLFKQLKEEEELLTRINNEYNEKKKSLEERLKNKATNNPSGIKYNFRRYGDQNYDIRSIRKDIDKVLNERFTPLTENEIKKSETIIEERVLPEIKSYQNLEIDIKNLSERVKSLVSKPVGQSDKIATLVRDSILNNWVKEGKRLHKEKQLNNCAFCGNEIKKDRWEELEKHFDEESTKLEAAINEEIKTIESLKVKVENFLRIDSEKFYYEFRNRVDSLINYRNRAIDNVKRGLSELIDQLERRKNAILNPFEFRGVEKFTDHIIWCWKLFEKIRSEANSYSSELGQKQKDAQTNLRLNEIWKFINEINYIQEQKRIDELKTQLDKIQETTNQTQEEIERTKKEIETKYQSLKDEGLGAQKVNEYLKNHFGINYLELKPIKDASLTDTNRFEIYRDGKKAYNLSEGERNLVAFCYFIARLNDAETKGEKPIIWIDDPISSLDNNHIFFVFSLIETEITSKKNFEQLFLSTHSLEFLKFLKKITGANKEKKIAWFIIQRINKTSVVRTMPPHLREYVTEFNFLFEQIYKCSKMNTDDETSFILFYNFGNNVRKFLDVLLYYKYPNSNKTIEKLRKYFGDYTSAHLVNRLENELSHLENYFEKGMYPIDYDEIKKVAEFIVSKIKERDPDQYDALLNSIGVTEPS